MMERIHFLAIFFVVVLTTEAASADKEHRVGDSIWSIPPTNNFYSEWASNRTFFVGDSLVFRFETGFYNVVQVSRREYESCTSENPFRTVTIGPVTVSLEEDGVYYYICNFGNYCLLGLKLYVAVHPRPPPT